MSTLITKVKTIVRGIAASGATSRLMDVAKEADEFTASLGNMRIVEIHDALYQLPDGLAFTRRILYELEVI